VHQRQGSTICEVKIQLPTTSYYLQGSQSVAGSIVGVSYI